MTKEQIGLGFKGVLNKTGWIISALIGANQLGAWLFMLLEDGHSYIESTYWAWVTSMSIGYGDISPATTAGRFVAIVLGSFVLYVITPLVVGKFVMSALHDSNAFTHAEQEEVKHEVRVTSETVILLNNKIDDMLSLLSVTNQKGSN